jgi:hypothetical protein
VAFHLEGGLKPFGDVGVVFDDEVVGHRSVECRSRKRLAAKDTGPERPRVVRMHQRPRDRAAAAATID